MENIQQTPQTIPTAQPTPSPVPISKPPLIGKPTLILCAILILVTTIAILFIKSQQKTLDNVYQPASQSASTATTITPLAPSPIPTPIFQVLNIDDEKTKEWTVYKSQTYHYSIKYPKTYKNCGSMAADGYYDDSYFILDVAKSNCKDDLFQTVPFFSMQAGKPGFTQVHPGLENGVSISGRFDKDGRPCDSVEKNPILVNSIRGTKYIISANDSQSCADLGVFDATDVVLENNKGSFYFHFYSGPDLTQLEQILGSFKLLDSNSE